MTKAWHGNLETGKPLNNSLVIEMNETSRSTSSSKDLHPASLGVLQSNDASNIKNQGSNYIQGSVLSLGSRSYIDQSDVQPLTNVHVCRYEECMKFHRSNTNSEEEGSPFSPLKNLLLYLIVVLLILWVIVYTVLNQLKCL